MSTVPRVSVVIPAHNAASFISGTLASVYEQTIAPEEVIVVNDGSTDETESVLRRLGSRLPPSFTWMSIPNSGGPATPRNLGIEQTNGEYVAFLDQDDIWYPTKLARQLEHFASEPGLALSFTGYRFVAGDRTRLVLQDDWDPDPAVVLVKLMISPAAVGPPSTVMIRREALKAVPPFDNRVGFSDDWKMWLHIAAAGLRMDYVPDVLVDYRWHGANLSSTTRSERLDSATRMFDAFFQHPGLPHIVRKRGRRCRSYWHVEIAIDAAQHGDTSRARRHILRAAQIRPLSIRPGWIRVVGMGAPPPF